MDKQQIQYSLLRKKARTEMVLRYRIGDPHRAAEILINALRKGNPDDEFTIQYRYNAPGAKWEDWSEEVKNDS